MIGLLVLATWSTLGVVPAEFSDIAEIIKDAQATNAALVVSGSAKFKVKLELEGKRAVEARGTFSWGGQNGFWVFNFSDPDGVFGNRGYHEAPVHDAPTEYMLVNADRLYTYDSRKNTLFINRIRGRDQISPEFALFDLFPDSLWYRCCAPHHHSGGRPWRDMFGSSSPASRPDSTHEMTATGSRTYRYTRKDPSVGVMEADFSLELAGSPTATKYTPASPKAAASQSEYAWTRLPGGAVVLKSCEATEARPGDPSSVAERFTLEIEILKVDKAVARSKFLPAELEKLLPGNTKVVDHVTNRSYPLHRDSGPPPDRLKDLSEELKGGGLLKNDGGRP